MDTLGVRLDEDMRAVIACQRLCFAATVTPDGKPNLSPKGTIRVWDDSHICFCDIASPQTRRNLETNPHIEINVVDNLSRRGYRFFGTATIHEGDAIHEEITERISKEEGAEYPIACVVMIRVERAEPLFSPGYEHIPTEREMRSIWKKKRAELDDAFERERVKD